MADTNDNNSNDKITDKQNYSLPLRVSLSNIFKNIAESISEDEFMQCMTASQLKPGVAKKMYNVLVKDVEDSLNADFDEMLADGNLDYGLGKLKDAIANAAKNKNEIAWRPPGDVQQHLRSPDMEKIHQVTNKLQLELDKIEAENKKLVELVDEKRKLARSIDEKVSNADKIVTLSTPRMEKVIDQLQEYALDQTDNN